jgi:predicted O-methyltransferase YrrM
MVYSKILRDRIVYPQYKIVKELREKLLDDHRYVEKRNLGASAHDISIQKSLLPVRIITKKYAVAPRYGELLFRISRFFTPEMTLELGTSLGISAAYLSLGNPEGRVITIEGCEETAALARENFDKLGLTNVRLVMGNFDEALPAILSEVDRLDMIFIDGNHRKDPTLDYFHRCLPHIHGKSVMILDDIHWSKGMEETWDEVRNHPLVKVTVDLFYMGLVFFRDELSKENFILRL